MGHIGLSLFRNVSWRHCDDNFLVNEIGILWWMAVFDLKIADVRWGPSSISNLKNFNISSYGLYNSFKLVLLNSVTQVVSIFCSWRCHKLISIQEIYQKVQLGRNFCKWFTMADTCFALSDLRVIWVILANLKFLDWLFLNFIFSFLTIIYITF